MKIKQTIIVEGKTDTAKLKNIFGAENVSTIETNGLGLTKTTMDLIKLINDQQGVIVFTDPDGPGIKIRDQINSYLNYKCFNAFIDKKSLINSKKIGIAEASATDIKAALSNLILFQGDANESISYQEYLTNNFYKKENRVKIAQHFKWSEKINAKTLFKWLNLLNLTSEDVKKILGD